MRRHCLSERVPATALVSAAAYMAGAQAQVLSAGQISIWARVTGARIQDVDDALWKKRSLVRAWCMRRTLFLLPSDELALFARGTFRRARYHSEWALSRISSRQQLEKLLDDIIEILSQPRTRNEIAENLRLLGYRLKLKAGGGWGNSRPVTHVEVGGLTLSLGYLLHMVDGRDVICSGPNKGNEPTYVRADRWVRDWKDMPVDKAEDGLFVRYMRAFGPATQADFALWLGVYIRDVKEIWSRQTGKMAKVEVDGQTAAVLHADLPELEMAKLDLPVVRLLPFFDSFLLGHRSHANIVDEKNRKKVYRAQGWVSPVLLVDGRARGVWSIDRRKEQLEVRVTPFSTLSGEVLSRIPEEAANLGSFLGCQDVKTIIA